MARVLTFVAVLALAGAALAAEAARPAKVGVVDLTRVFESSDRAKELNREAAEMMRQYTARLNSAKERVRELSSSAAEFAMGTPQRQEQEKKLEEMVKTARLLQQEAYAKENSARVRNTLAVYQDVNAAAEAVARRMGLDLIIRQRSLPQHTDEEMDNMPINALILEISQRTALYQAPDLDVTDAVIKELNAAYAKTKAGAKAAPGAAKEGAEGKAR
ncbi:MAG TPA: OmpH family outer membrane protein [Candidatus Brocadiia bacterium]|nr:OmpH family outer membrane protein [Candidatus Brocadiia bacterium]